MPLIGAQVLVTQICHLQRMAVVGEESAETADVVRIGANRVRAPVGLELKPAEIFVGRGAEIECHGCRRLRMIGIINTRGPNAEGPRGLRQQTGPSRRTPSRRLRLRRGVPRKAGGAGS